MTVPALALDAVSKSFAATQALSSVSLTVRAGEVHAVVGENGAGKSTLVNIVSGNLIPDSGHIVIDGNREHLNSPHHALRRGISTVHQELSVVEHLSVAENIFAAQPPKRWGIVRWGALARQAKVLTEKLSMPLEVSAQVGSLPVGSRQLVEIAKAAASNPRIILFDEPTSALNGNEKQALFKLILRLRAAGLAIIYISHHLQEIMQLADRVSVLRDGRLVGTWNKTEVNAAFLVSRMVGRDIQGSDKPRAQADGAVALTAEKLCYHGMVRNISFELRAGEILALAGQMGSGRSAIAAMLAGLRQPTAGKITWQGKTVSFHSLRQAMKAGIGYVPPERKAEGLFLDLSVGENIVAASLPSASRNGLFDRKRTTYIAKKFVEKLGIKAKSPAQRAGALSGGNQQKVLIAKWVARKPKLLILQEPTKGVDVAAKEDIHTMLRSLAAHGTAILVISSDLPEIIALAHRIVVMREGAIIAERRAAETAEEEIAALTSGIGGTVHGA